MSTAGQTAATTKPAAKAGSGSGAGGAGGTAPTVPSAAKNFKDGKTLRDGTDTATGTTADPKAYDSYKADVTHGQTIETPVDILVPAKSAAIFDEQALDPYEVYSTEFGIIK